MRCNDERLTRIQVCFASATSFCIAKRRQILSKAEREKLCEFVFCPSFILSGTLSKEIKLAKFIFKVSDVVWRCFENVGL